MFLFALYGNLCTFTVSEHFVLYNEAIAQWKPQTSTVTCQYDQQIVYFQVHFKFSTSIEVWLGN